jgi:hypothetical protein
VGDLCPDRELTMAYAKDDFAPLGVFESAGKPPRSIGLELLKRVDPVVLATWAPILGVLILAWSTIWWAIDKLVF